MTKQWFKTKAGSAILVAVGLVLAGTVASASAHRSDNNDNNNGNSGYSADQCKNGGWRDFKNPDGSQKFKNQGQCIKFFKHDGDNGGNNGGNNGHHGDNFIRAFFSAIFAFLTSFFGNLFGGLFSLRL